MKKIRPINGLWWYLGEPIRSRRDKPNVIKVVDGTTDVW